MTCVYIYYLCLDLHGFDEDLECAVDILDAREKARYYRFKNIHAQKCYLQARRIAKTVLGHRLNCRPSELSFAYTDTEKPFLKNSRWHFNISHSQSTIVLAVAPFAVGVDVEDIERCSRVWPNAGEFLNSHVKKRVDLCKTDDEAAAMFTEYWSCTESYIKLKGSAIYRDKDRVKVQDHSHFEQGRRYTFEDTTITTFDVLEGTRLSLACEREFPQVKLVDWRTGACATFDAPAKVSTAHQ